MIQFYTTCSNRFSLPEEAQMAIESGCRWINICNTGMTPDELKETAIETIPVCRENDAFLVIDNDIELVNELRVHGVRLTDGKTIPASAREILGPHAIIGVHVSSPADVALLRGVDVDYLTADTSVIDSISSEAKKLQLPVVAVGDVTVGNMKSLLASGAQGLGFSSAVTDAPDPVSYLRHAIDTTPGASF